jgi:hypothetical protein
VTQSRVGLNAQQSATAKLTQIADHPITRIAELLPWNIYAMIETAKLNGLDPEAFLRDVAISSPASPTTPSTAFTNYGRETG